MKNEKSAILKKYSGEKNKTFWLYTVNRQSIICGLVNNHVNDLKTMEKKIMNYSKSKSTKRFTFGVSRNDTAHKAGGNIVTIATNGETDGYSAGTTQLTLTVREALALQGFLNDQFDVSKGPVI